MTALVGQPGGCDISREIDQVFILGFPWQKQGALGRKVAGLHGHHSSVADRTVLQDFLFHQLEAAVRIAQENQAQYGHTVLIGSQLGACAQQVGGFPQVCFQFSDVYHIYFSFGLRRYSFVSPRHNGLQGLKI